MMQIRTGTHKARNSVKKQIDRRQAVAVRIVRTRRGVSIEELRLNLFICRVIGRPDTLFDTLFTIFHPFLLFRHPF